MITVSMGGTKTKKFTLQPMVNSETLRNYRNGEALPDNVIDAYNQYTKDINRATWHETREQLLDNRHKFYVLSCEG